MKTILIIGGGISGLVASINLKNKGFNVILIEKNKNLGGRLYQNKNENFILNNGPSWYWLPSIINNIYDKLGIIKKYRLKKLTTQYKIIFDKGVKNISGNYYEIKYLFNKDDPSSGKKLDKFMETSKYKYQKGFSKFIYYPNLLVSEYLNIKLFYYLYKFEIFKSYRQVCESITDNNHLRKILEWPSLFIGSNPKNITALYSLLTYSMLKEGTYIPNKKGMIEIIDLLVSNCYNRKVIVLTNTSCVDFIYKNNNIDLVKIQYNDTLKLEDIKVDYVINSADYHHIENILPNKFRSYPKLYWEKLISCPSSLIFNLVLNIKLPKLIFHNLFFKGSLDEHTYYIYNSKYLPPKPLFYVNITTKYFKEVNTEHESLFILVPSNPNIILDNKEIDRVYKYIIQEISNFNDIDINKHIIHKKTFRDCDFKEKFNSFKYNSYGLGCDKFQNIFIRPKLKSLYLNNLYYCGHITSPGPGIAPCMISGLNTSNQLILDDKKSEINNKEPQRYDTLYLIIFCWFKNVFFRLLTHFITLMCIIGFKREIYYGMKREFNYLVFDKLNYCKKYD